MIIAIVPRPTEEPEEQKRYQHAIFTYKQHNCRAVIDNEEQAIYTNRVPMEIARLYGYEWEVDE